MNFNIFSGLIGAFLGAIISAYYAKNSALRGESVWRKELFNITNHVTITESDVYFLRTCVSALRGSDSDEFDPNLSFKKENLDDLIIEYLRYLKEQHKDDEIPDNCAEKGFKCTSRESIVFRQLCRLLLKSDWNMRSDFFHRKDNTLKKAIIILNSIEVETNSNE